MATAVSVPDRPQFKRAEVCTITGLQPYVLRSWEHQFPSLGNGKDADRVYSRDDVLRVLEIKALVFDQGMTLGAARRKLLEDAPPEQVADDPASMGIDPEARQHLAGVKQGLREILGLLDTDGETTAADAGSSGSRKGEPEALTGESRASIEIQG